MTSEATDLTPLRAGDVLAGKYRVERVLGAGGMGVVIAARHVQLDQQVALKFLLPESLHKPKIVARFEREARAAVKLKGEHVARVLDVGSLESGAPYIVMEFLEGHDLAQLLKTNGPMPIAEAVDFLLQACEALAEAHGLGIVHRDLKPGNLFLTKRVDGKNLIKVLDFGISKLEGGREDLSLTETSEVVGSPKYMSPEQLRASRLADARSDIWSLGVILYELTSGQIPFVAETMAHLCALVISQPPRPLRELRADLPPGFEALIMRCLEKDPAHRFQNVAELAMALDPFTSAPESRAAHRVQAVAASSGAFPSVTSSSPNLTGSQSVSIGWGKGESPAPRGGRGKWIALGVALLCACAVAAFFRLRPHGAVSADTPEATDKQNKTADIASISSIAPTSSSSAPPLLSDHPTTSSANTAPSDVPQERSPNVTSHSHKPPKKANAPASSSTDDMPNERN